MPLQDSWTATKQPETHSSPPLEMPIRNSRTHFTCQTAVPADNRTQYEPETNQLFPADDGRYSKIFSTEYNLCFCFLTCILFYEIIYYHREDNLCPLAMLPTKLLYSGEKMPLQKSRMHRLMRIAALLKENRYPNSESLVKEFRRIAVEEELEIDCSRKTVLRDIKILALR